MKQFFYAIGCIGLAALLMMTLFSQEGGTYQFSPKSLKIRYVKTVYMPVVPIPVYRRIEQENDYMLSSLWKRLHLVSEKKKRHSNTQDDWVDILTWKPGKPSIEGPAYRLLDINTVGSPEYWECFAKHYPRESKRLFRRVIKSLQKGEVPKATKLLVDNAWMPIAVS
jgi:hypothetical protein